MKSEHLLDLRNNQDLSYLYASICYNIRSAVTEFAEYLQPLAYSTLELLCPFRGQFLQYLYKIDKIDRITYNELLENSYDFICTKTDDLITLVDVLKK